MSNPFSADLESEPSAPDQSKVRSSAAPSKSPTAQSGRTRSSYGDYGDRVPPQQMVISGTKPTKTEKSALTAQDGELVYNRPGAPPARRYVVYGDTDDELEGANAGWRRPKPTRLINFWASILAQCLSLPLLALSIYMLFVAPVSSALTITCTIGIVLASISLVIELAHCVPKLCPKMLQWQLGRHAMLHSVIGCFSVLPYIQHHTLVGLLFVLHFIPAALFYTARARRESIPAKI